MKRNDFAVLGVLLGVGLLGCGHLPKVDVVPTVDDGHVVFEVPHSGINGLLGIRVEDEAGNVLWDVETSYEKGHQITYGALPAGGNREARQEFPPENRPPADIRGKTVTVSVSYQYDEPWAACSDTFRKVVRVP